MPRSLIAALAVLLVALPLGCPRQAPESLEPPVMPPVAQNPAPPAAAESAQPAAPAEAGAEASASAAPTQQGAAAPEPVEPAPASPEPTPDAGSSSRTPPRQAEGPAAAGKPAAAKPVPSKPRPQTGKKWPIPEGPLNDDKYVAISAKYAAAVMATPEKERTEEALKTLLREVLKEAKVPFDEYQEYTVKIAADAERTEKVGKWIVQALADGGVVNLSRSAGVPGQDLKLRGVVEDDKKGK